MLRLFRKRRHKVSDYVTPKLEIPNTGNIRTADMDLSKIKVAEIDLSRISELSTWEPTRY